MKQTIVFILTFAILSALPFLWHQFSFVDVGFPFAYLHRANYIGFTGTGTNVSFLILNLFYDLLFAVMLIWVSYKFIKNNR
jgi:hypothetical protein